jgi:hypothetical protein
MTKKVFQKALHRVQSYKQHLPVAPLPLEPVPTRWGTWIEVNSEHFESVKPVVHQVPV